MKNNQLDESDPLPLVKLFPRLKEYSSLNFNGFEKIINELKVKVFSEVEDCYWLWEKFSVKESLFDLWDFRYAWYLGYRYKPYFYCLIYKKQILGFIPLWYDPVKKRYEWFGSQWMEDNKFFVIDEKFVPLLIKILPKPFYLNAILPNYNRLGFFERDEPKYIRSLANISHIDQLLYKFGKKHRYHLRRDYQYFLSLSAKIFYINRPTMNDLIEFLSFAQEVFNVVNRGDWHDIVLKERFEVCRQLIKKNSLFKTSFIKVYIQNKLAAIDMIITYKNIFYPLKAAYDTVRFSGIGNFMNYLEFEKAIENNYSVIDCLQGDYNWKNKYYQSLSLLKIERR